MNSHTPFARSAKNALLLRCPLCGKGKPFAGLIRMKPHCSTCGFIFEREAGYFLGSTYINYGFTAGIALLSFLILRFYFSVESDLAFVFLLLFCLTFPFLIFRQARLLWSAFDLFWDPAQEKDFVVPGPASPRDQVG